jgi:hypothetical protein
MSMNFPRMARIRQRFERQRVDDIVNTVRRELERILPSDIAGKRIAVAAGSRGIRNIALVIQTVVCHLQARGAAPFIVPAMGSHGGATAAGQVEVLRSLGVTEDYCGAPVRSSMEVVQIGRVPSGCGDGVPVYLDRNAAEADGVILVNRIKTHTDFKGEIESGLMKMSAIGLGKQTQALVLHRDGTRGIRDVMKQVAGVALSSGKILGGVAIIENAYDETAHIEAIRPADIPAREADLLRWSKTMMPKLPVEDIDLLVIDEMGKNYSGTGIDTNIIGRMRIPGEPEPPSPRVKYVFVRALSDASHGNAAGIGLVDLITRRLFERIDLEATKQNVATSTFLARAAIPIVLDNDQEAIREALRACWGVRPEAARIVHIPNTLELENVRVSEPLLGEVQDREGIEILGPAEPMAFDAQGNLNKSGS